ncbi:NupC/NupG family nucleoside CNT transporter [Candidatus Magnetaquicoccus inordinatus]|uniref:NupC/NupG family nucleoside CNT transporter n=1 Tax=Candidatus Magnetaquicoccus inordinatus TaxID=2496818 RepID=UPI00102B0E2E|nr:nucleoside transporter C-terminal domain-containing protein [Candidatus Magnetaquicoccus inordinatus]
MWHSLAGFFIFLALAWLLSENRRAIAWRTIAAGVLFQWLLGAILLKLSWVREAFMLLNEGVLLLEQATMQGTAFVFGYLGGATLPFAETVPSGSYILAFRALPMVLVISALASLLFYWQILPWIVRGFSVLLQKSLGIGGALGLAAGATIFVGMVEAPLLIRPYLRQMGRGELFGVMATGMATIAGTMMVIYAAILGAVIPDALGHILIASLLSAPAALTVALLMVPQSEPPTTGELHGASQANSAMDALTRGTMEGITLLINIIAFLIVLVSLVALLNGMLHIIPPIAGEAITLQRVLGWLMAPLTWLMGIPWSEAQVAGMLMGEKTVLNEFIAYLHLARLPPELLSERSRIMTTYALCGFANLGSLGILLGGLGSMVPERHAEVVALGVRSLLAGTLATLMTGAIVGAYY